MISGALGQFGVNANTKVTPNDEMLLGFEC